MSDLAAAHDVVAVLNDLIFETKIRSTAQALGVAVCIVRSTDSLKAALDASPARLVIVDLNTAAPDACAAVAVARAHLSNPRIIAYVSHVDAQLAAKAREAGAHQVLPRSRFHLELPDLLATPG